MGAEVEVEVVVEVEGVLVRVASTGAPSRRRLCPMGGRHGVCCCPR